VAFVLDALQLGGWHALLEQPALVETNRIPFTPVLEQLGWEGDASLPFIVCRVPAHPEGFGKQHHGTFTATASLHGESGRGKGIEHIVALEGPARHPVGAGPTLEALGRMVLIQTSSQRHLIVLNDEDHRRPLHRREVEPFVGHTRLGGSIADPGDGNRRTLPASSPRARSRHTPAP
jgi:hypothetical protein